MTHARREDARTAGVRRVLLCCVLTAAVVAGALGALPPSALASSPWWAVSSTGAPTDLPPGGTGAVSVVADNVGDADIPLESSPVTIVDHLPQGLTATEASGNVVGQEGFSCTILAPREVECVAGESATLHPYGALEPIIAVSVEPGAPPSGVNEVSVSGGGAPPVTRTSTIRMSATPARFGLEEFEITPEEEGGTIDEQAGSHPFQLRTTFSLATVSCGTCTEGRQEGRRVPPELPRNVSVKLPPGLLGNPTVLPECNDQEFTEFAIDNTNYCPADTAVGVVRPSLTVETPPAYFTRTVPLFNLTPRPGEPARFGFVAEGGVPVILDTALRTGEDYGVNVFVNNLSEAAGVDRSEVIFWGVPSDSRHNASRGWKCIDGRGFELGPCEEPEVAHPKSFLSMPGVCGTPLQASMSITSWATPSSTSTASYTFQGEHGNPLGFTGCDRLPFEATIGAAPDTESADTTAGVTMSVHVPQEASLGDSALSQAAVKDTTLTLPEGLVVNAAAAGGLQACSLEQIALDRPGRGTCPDASKIGTVEIHTPLLSDVVGGDVYAAAQGANPFGSLLAMYIVADDPAAGVVVKIPVDVRTDPATGRLTAVVSNAPQLPFEDLTLRLFGGPRAVLISPAYCGAYTTSAMLSPWSGGAAVGSSTQFKITSGIGGSACALPQPFIPGFSAGSTSAQAGAFTPLQTSVSRGDVSQALSKVQLRLPPGLLGSLASVTRCQEPAASQGTCPASSQIGDVSAQVGAGSEPFTVAPGPVSITGPYEGAPFGLSIAEPAKAGPFDLGTGPCDCVVVRARIDVDPKTAALTITTDPLPQILQGIPLSIRNISVSVDRGGFTFNPTNCKATTVAATLEGGGGAAFPAAVPFQVANCAKLRFAPRFTALTSAKTSKANGAYLHVRITTGHGDANIAKVKVNLPMQLPSRLTTLQKACTDKTFEAGPGGCQAASVVGEATAVTPVLAQPLRGKAYLVSHRAAAFPDLVMVLQGEGITLDLVGATEIKHGITSSIFRSVPDAPITSFDLVLPEGPHSVLAAFGSLCAKPLTMPTQMTGQNGVVVKQTTKIAVSGCPSHKTGKRPRGALRSRSHT